MLKSIDQVIVDLKEIGNELVLREQKAGNLSSYGKQVSDLKDQEIAILADLKKVKEEIKVIEDEKEVIVRKADEILSKAKAIADQMVVAAKKENDNLERSNNLLKEEIKNKQEIVKDLFKQVEKREGSVSEKEVELRDLRQALVKERDFIGQMRSELSKETAKYVANNLKLSEEQDVLSAKIKECDQKTKALEVAQNATTTVHINLNEELRQTSLVREELKSSRLKYDKSTEELNTLKAKTKVEHDDLMAELRKQKEINTEKEKELKLGFDVLINNQANLKAETKKFKIIKNEILG